MCRFVLPIFNTSKDLEKLRALVFSAYEAEVKKG
jgi:hypothetical protein